MNALVNPRAWTEERIERLKVLWADGLSGSQIAGELGLVTRNAVIGKVHRLGLSGRARPRPRRARSARPLRPTLARLSGLANVDIAPLAEEPAPVADLEIPAAQRRTLLALTGDTCRWPVGDPQSPEFFFCGGVPVDHSPYCAWHTRLGLNPTALRPLRPPYEGKRQGSARAGFAGSR